MSQQALLAIDLGTSGVKVVVVFVADFRPLGEAVGEYRVLRPQPGWAESSPESWWQETVRAVRSAMSAAVDAAGPVEVVGIGLDGQMHGLVLTDDRGQPVRPALLWADRRATDQARRWQTLPDERLRDLANPISPGMTGPMWAWVNEHEPALAAAARWVLLPKDWLRHALCGTVATEPSDASATLLWNVREDRWAYELLEPLQLDPAMLPPVRPSAAAAGGLTERSAAELGLPAGIPVATGAADTAAALLGTQLRDPAGVQITVGTGAQIVRPLLAPLAERRPIVHSYRTAGTGWYAMAAVQNAGLALEWVARVFGVTWHELYSAARRRPPGADGVTFVPYLTGERTPVMSVAARGAFYGLDHASDRSTILQAAVEGVAFAIRHAFEALPGPPPAEVRLAGGGARSEEFSAVLADVLALPLRPLRERSASAVGAAMLAAHAAGMPVADPKTTYGTLVEPSASSTQYQPAYARYRELSAQLVQVADADQRRA